MNTSVSTSALPTILNTEEAATALNRSPQTLRKWACLGTGAVKPLRINGRLAWRLSDILEILTPPTQHKYSQDTVNHKD